MIDEPAVALTDYLLGVVAGALAIRRARGASTRPWAVGFGAVAAGSFLGGTWHGFHDLDPLAREWIWWGTLLALGVGASAFVVAASTTWGDARRRLLWRVVAAIQLAVWVIWIRDHDAFLAVSVAWLPAFALITATSIRASRRGDANAAWATAAVAAAIVGGAIQALGPDPSPHFDRNALYHVILVATLLLLDHSLE